MTSSKKNTIKLILTISLLLVGSVWSSIFVSKNSDTVNFPQYEFFIWAVLFLLMAILLNINKKYLYIYTIQFYIIFYFLQLIVIWDLINVVDIWEYLAIVFFFFASIGFLNFLKKIEYHQELMVNNITRVLFSIFLVFLYEVSVALFIFLQLDEIQKITSSIPDEIKELLPPFDFITSMVGLCGVLLLIKFSMKIEMKDFLKRIGIFSMRDLKTGLFVFISIILFLQVAEIVLTLFLEHSFFKRYYYYHNFTETRILPMIDMFGVGLREEIVYRGFLFYIVCITVNKSKKPIINPLIVIVLSQVLFSLSHLPNRLINSDLSNLYICFELARLFIFGVFFVIIYIRMNSIYAAIFIHTLFNYYGSPIYSGAGLISANAQLSIIILFVITLLLFWDHLPNFRTKRNRIIPSGFGRKYEK